MAKKSTKRTGTATRSAKKSTKKKVTKKTTKKKSPVRKTTKKTTRKSAAADKKKTAKKVTKKVTKKKSPTRKVAKSAAKVTKKTTKKKITKSDVQAEQEIIRKSPLSKKDLQHYRDLLLIRRAEILGDITSMSTEALRADASNLSNMPLHMADVGSDYYEQELTLGLVESERAIIQEINEALGRIADGTYGVCQKTGKRINKARLNAKPWAQYCIEAAREMERHNHNHR